MITLTPIFGFIVLHRLKSCENLTQVNVKYMKMNDLVLTNSEFAFLLRSFKTDEFRLLLFTTILIFLFCNFQIF